MSEESEYQEMKNQVSALMMIDELIKDLNDLRESVADSEESDSSEILAFKANADHMLTQAARLMDYKA